MNNEAETIKVQIDPIVKKETESVLDELGVSMSTIICGLCHYIIEEKEIPFKINEPSLPTLDEMTESELNDMLEEGYQDIQNGNGMEISEAFAKIRQGIIK